MRVRPVHIIIVAGGSGIRFGAERPKQFVEIAGRPVLLRAIDSMRAALPDASLTVVINKDWEEYFLDLCNKFCVTVPIIAYGGSTRWESVRNGLDTAHEDTFAILVHDGARPFPSKKVVKDVLKAVTDGADGAVPAIPVTDTIRATDDDGITSEVVDRSRLRAVQTPQAFNAKILKTAYQLPYNDKFTDDASVMESAGFSDIRLTPGSPVNIKVTNPGDIAVAEAYLKSGMV